MNELFQLTFQIASIVMLMSASVIVLALALAIASIAYDTIRSNLK